MERNNGHKEKSSTCKCSLRKITLLFHYMLFTVLSALHGSSHLIVSKKKKKKHVKELLCLSLSMQWWGPVVEEVLTTCPRSLSRFIEDGAGIVIQGVWLLHPCSSPLHHRCHEDSEFETCWLKKEKKERWHNGEKQLGQVHFENQLDWWGNWPWYPDIKNEEF